MSGPGEGLLAGPAVRQCAVRAAAPRPTPAATAALQLHAAAALRAVLAELGRAAQGRPPQHAGPAAVRAAAAAALGRCAPALGNGV